MRRIRLYPSMLILAGCLGATVFSGHSLFFSDGADGLSWLDGVFLLAILIGVVVGVWMMARGATETIDRYLDDQQDRSRE